MKPISIFAAFFVALFCLTCIYSCAKNRSDSDSSSSENADDGADEIFTDENACDRTDAIFTDENIGDSVDAIFTNDNSGIESNSAASSSDSKEPAGTTAENKDTNAINKDTDKNIIPETVFTSSSIAKETEPVSDSCGGTQSDPSQGGSVTEGAYVAPDDMYSPIYSTKTIYGGDYDLKRGVVGLKVKAVQEALGMQVRHYGRYTEKTKSLVMQFQSENGLDATGIVNLKTWEALGLSYQDWLYMGTYAHPIAIEEHYTNDQIIEAFINVGRSYIGTEFVTGAAGKAGEGADCSGFVLQCLYAIGIYPDGLDPVQHSVEGEYNCIAMYNDSKFRNVEYKELQPGDLVFYRSVAEDNQYSVNHVAIYIGNGKCLEAWIDRVDVYRIDKLYLGYEMIGYRRVIW